MRARFNVLWRMFIVIALASGGAIFSFGAGSPAQTINLPDPAFGNGLLDDPDVPDVTARVARISFIRGYAQVKRADGDDWETATLNLPLVEGDEIATGLDSRIEIQFDNAQFLRLAENSYVKLTVLKDEGTALSLSLGTLSLTITRFDKDRSYFEIDAPKTTLAIQKTGQYRIDAGNIGAEQVRVAVDGGGEVRVYSETAGFSLKSGRSARVFISGDNAGEWENEDLAGYADDFDKWSLERDDLVAQSLASAYYGKYYDQDIYGANDLNGYGSWVNLNSYGNVWQPSPTAIGLYANWSPYRYGAWRWIAPFGWTWVNDEPWGWATYHYGRWFYNSGNWYWSPYSYYRPVRSWWFPALVAFNSFNNNVYWYPLSYHHHYCNYNAYYNNHHGGGQVNNPPAPVIGPIAQVPKPRNIALGDEIPPAAVVAVSADDFGKRNVARTAQLKIAKDVLAQTPDYTAKQILPERSAVLKRAGSDIVSERPRSDAIAAGTKVGAARRSSNIPLDIELRSTRMLGGRAPVSDTPVTDGETGNAEPRTTGAVERQPARVRDTGSPRMTLPTVVGPPAVDPPTRQVSPTYVPPARQTPRSAPAPSRQSPTKEVTPRSSPPSKAKPDKSAPSSRPSGSAAKASKSS